MPRYRNGTSNRIPWRHYVWESGETKDLPVFVPHEALGLTLVSGGKVVPSPILMSQEVALTAGALSATITLPYAAKVGMTIYAKTGSGVLTLGDSEIEIPLEPGATYEGTFPWHKVGSIKLESDAPATFILFVEEVE